MIAALSKLTTERQVADCGGVGGGFSIGGRTDGGAPFTTYELVGSAYGARTGMDGASGVSVLLTNASTAPVADHGERVPGIRFRRWELICDSGGPGAFRGGLGPRREYDLLVADAGAHAAARRQARNPGARGSPAEIPAGSVRASSIREL